MRLRRGFRHELGREPHVALTRNIKAPERVLAPKRTASPT
jgi:hypothetical protein